MDPVTRLKAYRAAKAYKDFTGEKASKISTRRLDAVDQAGYRMGSVVGIAYEARRDGERAQYFHRFKTKSRPDLISRDDGKQIYIEGGSYKITDRGIEDRMPTLFVVNPSKRKGSSMARRARRRNASGQFTRSASGGGYRRRRRSRSRARNTVTVLRTNPVRRRRRRARTALSRALPFRTNPIRRRRRSYRMRRNPIRRRRYLRGFRRNPIGRGALGLGQVTSLIVPGMLTGGGAVGAEVVMGYLPIPASWKTGYVRHLVKGVLGVTGGLVIADVLRMPKLGEYFALGAIAIASHDALKDLISAQMPNLAFGSYLPGRVLGDQFGYASPAQVVGMGEYVQTPQAQW
jgi:hypothetical protein